MLVSTSISSTTKDILTRIWEITHWVIGEQYKLKLGQERAKILRQATKSQWEEIRKVLAVYEIEWPEWPYSS
jgi:hypothetical protein